MFRSAIHEFFYVRKKLLIHEFFYARKKLEKLRVKVRTPCFVMQREGRREMNDLKTVWKKSSPTVPQVVIDQIVHQCETKASKEDKIDTELPSPTGIAR